MCSACALSPGSTEKSADEKTIVDRHHPVLPRSARARVPGVLLVRLSKAPTWRQWCRPARHQDTGEQPYHLDMVRPRWDRGQGRAGSRPGRGQVGAITMKRAY